MSRLKLPTVTLCAVTSVNVRATVDALEASLEQIDFAECLLLTDAEVAGADPRIRIVPIEHLASGTAYSHFLLSKLADHVSSDHCLVIQWDGFVLDARRWDPRFLSYDYIGAPWPQFDDGNNVGNGGFSLRSRKLLEAFRDPRFQPGHPEDVAICRTNKALLEEEHGIRFADPRTAASFSYERTEPAEPTLGFHGIFNMIPALGPERFWRTYSELDERSTAFADYGLLMRQLGRGRNTLRRRLRLTCDLLKSKVPGRRSAPRHTP